MYSNSSTKGFRYSRLSNYWVQDIKTGQLRPLDPDQKGDIPLAKWSPKDPNVIAFVRKNNIYLWNDGKITTITTNGSPYIYNGVPDWVYEEEVIEARSTMWFSPDGEYIAFLSFDDTNVPTYSVPYYMNNHKNPQPYPFELKIRYPKPGFPNPTVTGQLFKVSDPSKMMDIPLDSAFPKDDIVVGELAWMTKGHDKLIVRCFNRIQNHDKHLLYEVPSGSSKIIRERDEKDGWLDNPKAMKYVGDVGGMSGNDTFYIDVSDKDGWTHIYVYPVNGGEPKQLTSGKWEIRSVDKVDTKNGFVYFSSTENHPTESHPYSVSLVTGEKKPLVKPDESAHWEASYSAGAEYVILNYLGPNVPYQELYFTNSTGPNKEPIRILEENAALTNRLKEYALPKTKYMDLAHPSGYNLSAMLLFPPTFSEDKKYPVLLTPYGGPTSQEVKKTFQTPGWASFITSSPSLEFVTYTVDNRGTGFRGRAFRNFYYKAMGTVDAEDQIWAARELAKQPWVDTEHIGIWGWSNGGYLSAKVVEHNTDVIKFAIATAPTVDDKLYDSIYSERFMGHPDANKAEWERAAIRNATGFKNLPGGILIQHGTGDDNVHFAHTLGLLDMLMEQGCPPDKVTVQPYTDSDHNIRYGRDAEFMYKQLTQRLFAEKNRKPKKEEQEWDEESTKMKITDWVERVERDRNMLMEEPLFNAKWSRSEMGLGIGF
jgi:dipeptidyl-peptidase 4